MFTNAFQGVLMAVYYLLLIFFLHGIYCKIIGPLSVTQTLVGEFPESRGESELIRVSLQYMDVLPFSIT